MGDDCETELVEVFGFISSGREDVRKMAVQGLAQQSKDNKKLFALLASSTHGPRCIDVLLQFLHAGSVALLGDVLTVLINCAADGTCTEVLVTQKVVRRAMRLIDSVEASDHPQSLQRGLEEMTLMLLSNLTASHVSAVDDLLQVTDEDLRGFYLGKLLTYYTRFTVDDGCSVEVAVAGEQQQEDGGDDNKKLSEGDAVRSNSGGNKSEELNKTVPRDLQRWILQILLNVTRVADGQELLLEDDDWLMALSDCLSSLNPRHRLLAAQCFRNCSFQRERHPGILRSRCLRVCVERLSDGAEHIGEIEMLLAEITANLMQTEAGIGLLEELNAKKHLQASVTAGKVQAGTCKFLNEHVLPLLDDIVDAYVMTSGDELD